LIVYKATNLINNKIYIGKTVISFSQRRANHLSVARNKKDNFPFHAAIRKYGEENFAWEIIDRCLFAESLIALEQHYIKLYNCKAPNGYNLTDGGDGITGFKHSEETKKKMSESMVGKTAGNKNGNYGKPKSEETLKKMRKPHGPMSEETKQKDREAHLGKHPSIESREKMSKSQIGTKHPWGKPMSEEKKKERSEATKLWWENRKKLEEKK
jgi:hypothetical protein